MNLRWQLNRRHLNLKRRMRDCSSKDMQLTLASPQELLNRRIRRLYHK